MFVGDVCEVEAASAWWSGADPGAMLLEAVRELRCELSESRWAV